MNRGGFGEEIIAIILSELLKAGIKYTIKKKVDEVGNNITQLIQVFDDDADGVIDREELIYTIESLIPDLSADYCIVNKDDEIGIGFPELRIIDNTDMADMLDEVIVGNNNGVIVDGDTYVPLPFDTTGDGVNDWGKIVDADDNGIPDASPEAPFYPGGSDGYNQIIQSVRTDEKSFIIVSAEGTVSIYDPNGDLTEEDYNQAYTLWLQDNAALDKPFKNYSVTEALLLIVALFAGVSLIGKLFKRRIY